MDVESLRFAQVVRVALVMVTAPVSCWQAAREVPVIGDAIAGVLGKVLDRAWPDPVEKAKMAIAIEEMRQNGDFRALDAELERSRQQVEVNKVEAASPDRFVSGWRPAIGWVCACALGWHYIGRPIASWTLLMTGADQPIPAVELGDLWVVMLGMLGLSGMRSYDKAKGTALH